MRGPRPRGKKHGYKAELPSQRELVRIVKLLVATFLCYTEKGRYVTCTSYSTSSDELVLKQYCTQVLLDPQPPPSQIMNSSHEDLCCIYGPLEQHKAVYNTYVPPCQQLQYLGEAIYQWE